MTTEQETILREALQAAYRAPEPSDGLRQRVAALAKETAASAPSRRSLHLRVGLRLAGGAATALVILMLIFGSRSNAVYAFQHIADSLQHWHEKLSEGVAAKKITPAISYQGHPIRAVIRDFQVNTKGDVFLLFTANTEVGRHIPFGTADLTDEFGTKYASSVFQHRSKFVFSPTSLESGIANNRTSGYLFNNEEVEGCWWVPLQPQGRWKPRRFTLTLRLPHVGSAVFTLPVQKPATANLPEYMPYMARPLPAAYMEADDAETRAYSYWHDAHDLPQALAWYHKTIDLNSAVQRKFGYQPYNAYQWFDVYQVLMEMGRTEEAKAALLRAKADDDRSIAPTETRPWIQAAMKKLGMTP